ncbi:MULTISPECIES: metallophosphoesterase [Virgibacillus]|uniref:Metallophosphoesterase n=1 Tax=Virgibacillus pantothenticus TaxID=1473 RepID=A0A0L0QND8_VIRPA|nr:MULTISPECIES: metallophosphoesterase [Virgibacillus]API93732.1 metallophosphoesterase [Virgibacillus sp. 6R]KNE20019.1 metallophosphoesterase [Virgibacillus pantothenticus]MBS7429856.1 metallophosphoesterase [Virgibacillus sp. 19R1-5]MBU8565049.1 metallophosphoesterase [Virgibacillus pantothenticus]MBU8599356.1 metallophosphoesterase [Virgibacillus pantothenticus]
MNRRTFLKKALGSLFALLGLSGGTFYYAKDVEPILLRVNKNTVESSKIAKAFDDFKIVQFSDTHIGFHYTLEQLKDLVKKINGLQPDLIVFTGDLVDEPQNFHWDDTIIHILKKLQAPKGKFWIYGNHDHGGYGTEVVLDTMEKAGFQLLQNNNVTIKEKNESIILAGIDDLMLGKPDITKTLSQANTNLFTILLAHEPDFADKAAKHPIDLQLSGHSHGGQIRFPFIGHIYSPAYAEKYVQGEYNLNGGNMQLFVNSGIGTTRLPFRFLCKPEIHVYTLKSKA